MEYSSIFVCLMGMGTVFFGLICLIALTYLMSAVVGRGKKAAPAPVPAAPGIRFPRGAVREPAGG